MRLITVAHFAVTISFLHVHTEFILLITPHVRVTHEKQCVVIVTYRGRHKVQFDLGLLL